MTTDTPKRKRPLWHWIAGIVGVLIVLAALGSMGDDDAADPITSAPDAPAATDKPVEPTAVPTDAPAAPPFGDIEAKRVDATDIQWDAYVKTLAGTRAVDWPGMVREVKDAGGGAVKVSVDLTPGGGVFGATDTFIETTNADAVNWSKDTAVVVNGTIKRVGSVLGSIVVTFDDGATVAVK